MERYEEERDKALKRIKVADHMLNVTYPLLKEPKLLVSVMENLFLSLTNSMSALLYYERKYKSIPLFADNFDSKYEIFKTKTADKYHLEAQQLRMMREIKNLLVEHKKSPVEFAKGGKFVICSEDYTIKTVSVEDMKEYISKAKAFIQDINFILQQNESRNSRILR